MRPMLLGALAAAVFASAAPAAFAAQYIDFADPAADGSISGVFGNDGGIAAGDFTDTFTFDWPANGATAGTASSSFTSFATDLNFSSVTLNGVSFTKVSGGPGESEVWVLDPAQATLGGTQTLIVTGVSPGTTATYSGTLSFTPATNAVPEPATWALMILGFGGAGVMLRRRRPAIA